MSITLAQDPDQPNLFSGLYQPADGSEPNGIVAAIHPTYGVSFASLLSSSVSEPTTVGYTVTVNTVNWPLALGGVPVEIYLKEHQCWAIINMPGLT